MTTASLPDPAPGAAELEALERPEAYPGDPSAAGGATRVQTHLSDVFLTGARVYKFRKALDLGFARFRTREERNADCLREVALNRRLSPDVYLGVAPLRGAGVGAHVGAVAEDLAVDATGTAEHCVVMRRLPEGRDALSLLSAGRLENDALDRVAEAVAGFHARHGLGRPAPFEPEAWRRLQVAPVEENFRVLKRPGASSPELVARAERLALAAAEAHRPQFERRRREGRAVDGHGDLHLQHIWLETDAAAPLIIDCVEFNASLRRVDAASEVAFTAMDLGYRGHSRLGERFLRVYARERDDFGLYGVVDYFVAYRAAVRAKVAAIAAGESEIDPAQRARAAESVERHLAFAVGALESKPAPALTLVCGAVGTGKSTAAELLADATRGVAISSDRVRKALAGLSPRTRVAAGDRRVLYSEATTDRTYAELLERAGPVLASGRVVVLDATFARSRHREEVLRFAEARGVPAYCVEMRCDAPVALARLARRTAADDDPSDAGPERFAASVRAFEALDEWPAARRVVVDTARDDWRQSVTALVARFAPEANPRSGSGG